MSDTIIGTFESRRDAELAVEHLVQEHGVERTDIFIQSASADNTSGEVADGADAESGHPGVETDAEPVLEGAIQVSVDVNGRDDEQIREIMREAGAKI